MTKSLLQVLKTLVFFSVGFFVLYLVYQNQNTAYLEDCKLKGISSEDCSLLKKVGQDIASANYWWIGFSMLLFMVTNLFRALRWKMMLEAMEYKTSLFNLFGTIMVNYLANLGIPRSGEILRAGMLSGYEKVPVEKVLGTIFTDRIFDVICLGLVILLALYFGGSDFSDYLNKNARWSMEIPGFSAAPLGWALILVGIIMSFVAFWYYRQSILHSALGKKVWDKIKGFYFGVASVRKVSSIPLFLFYTAGIWIIYYFMLYVSFSAFGPTTELGPIAALMVFTFGSLGILFPSPGGMGSYHMLVGESLGIYGVSGSDAFAFANIVFFSIQIGVNVIFGFLFLILLPLYNKPKELN